MAIQGETRQKPRSRIREPKRYQVIMHNDDYTPMDFVVKILMEVFHKGKEEAVALMMNVHKGGQAAVGSYPYDIAVSKIRIVTERAKEEGYPFRLTLKEA
ncbi:ATP-dependent Clp protease adaptor ClpS [Otoolea muris]|uniref:ATP-dependent Clp protease adaptor ClpS n=1 Tax=Otoolea muris TaxID=2941515 RepID=UPI00203D52D2|nr:ATP-dependent Clp protease adaptor ClpS [Otoolea muris]